MEAHECKRNDEITVQNPSLLPNIFRIPPELWTKIFEYLERPTDLLNVSRAVTYWEDILHPTKSTWMFKMVFPLLFEHLSKKDILNCRQVCNRWCKGVDYFLENNAFHRPSSGDQNEMNGHLKSDDTVNVTTIPNLSYKTYFRSRPLLIQLATKNLMYKLYPGPLKIKLLNEAALHKRCPFVGRAVCLTETANSLHHPNDQFLRAFGHHIWFLKIGLGDLSPVDILTRILDLITLCPNLKKLDIYGNWVPPIPSRFQTDSLFQERQLSLYVESRYASEIMRRTLPRLETLDVDWTGPCHTKMKEILLSLFCTANLQSLSMNLIPIPPQLEMVNLVDLALSLDSNTQLTHLLQLKAPLQRLTIHLSGSVSPNLVFEVFASFQPAIRQIGLNLRPEFYLQLVSQRLPEILHPFSSFRSLNVLQGLHVKTVCIKGCQPVSFNFLHGLRKHLEYLHLYIEDFQKWETIMMECLSAMTKTEDKEEAEVLDLLQLLKILPNSSKLKMYESNAWIVFPRLKVLTVMLWKDGDTVQEDKKVEWEYRRDVYERIKCAS